MGQEATHRRLHELYNQHLAVLGYENRWAPRVVKRLKRLEVFADKRHKVAVTASTEHLTAIFAAWLLHHPSVLAQALNACASCGCGMPARSWSTVAPL